MSTLLSASDGTSYVLCDLTSGELNWTSLLSGLVPHATSKHDASTYYWELFVYDAGTVIVRDW